MCLYVKELPFTRLRENLCTHSCKDRMYVAYLMRFSFFINLMLVLNIKINKD